MHVRMRSYIGCICLAFLHCVFSNVSSLRLPERIYNHIGSICLAFPHCVFSNASSNYLHLRMQSCIGSICLAFLHCVLSNVSSNCLNKGMQSYIGRTYVTFFQSFLYFSLKILNCSCFYSNRVVQDQNSSPAQHGRTVVSSSNLVLNWRQRKKSLGLRRGSESEIHPSVTINGKFRKPDFHFQTN